MQLTKQPRSLTEQQACEELDRLYHAFCVARKSRDFIAWAESGVEKSGMLLSKHVSGGWWYQPYFSNISDSAV